MSELFAYLPPYYTGSTESRTIQEAIQPEIDGIWTVNDELRLQLNPYTATWGLALWEQAFGIPVNESKAVSLRRAAIISKIRGVGVVTADMLKNMAEAFTHAPVTVTDMPRESMVWFRFELLDIPAFFSELRDALLEVMPAHLDFTLEGVLPTVLTEKQPEFSLYRFTQRFALSSLWYMPPMRFDGSIRFDAELQTVRFDGGARFDGASQFGIFPPVEGSCLFDQTYTLTHWTGFTVSTAMPPVQERVGATLTIDNLYSFDGSVSFNGARRFDASITQEVI